MLDKSPLKKGIKTLYYYLLCQILNPTSHGVDPYENSQLKYSLTKKLVRNNDSAVLLSIQLKVNEGNYKKWLVRKARGNQVTIRTLFNTKARVVVLLIGEAVDLERMVDTAWKGKSKSKVSLIKEKWFNKKTILSKDPNGPKDSEISWSPGISNSIKFNLAKLRDLLDNPNFFSNISRKGSVEIEKAAQENGLFTLKYSNNVYIISPGIKSGFLAAESANTSAIKREITNNKVITKDILSSAGLPVPQGVTTVDYMEGKNYLASINKAIVVKPIDGSEGKGISVDIQNEEQLKIAWDYAKEFSDKIILEEMVAGTDIRILVFGGEALAAQMRVPAHIVGDGKTTVEQLIHEKNNLRLKNPRLDNCLIKINAYSYEYLKRQNHSLHSIPKDGEVVFLHLKANLSAGGDNIIVTEKMNPDLMRLAEEATLALKMNDFLGVDLLVEDMFLTRHQQDCKIIEVNSRAGLRGVQYPLYGPPFNTQNELIKKTIIEKGPIKEFEERKVYVDIRGNFGPSLKKWIREEARAKDIREDITIDDGKAWGSLHGKEDDLYGFLAKLMEWKDIYTNTFIDGVTVFDNKPERKPISGGEGQYFKNYIRDQKVNTFMPEELENQRTSNMNLVLKELNHHGYKAESITDDLISIEKGGRTGITGINPNSEFARNICKKVYPAKKILALNGFPVLRGVRTTYRKRRIGQKFLKIHGDRAVATFEYPQESHTYRIKSTRRLTSLCKKAISKGGKGFLMEEDIKNNHLCIGVVGHQAVSALALEAPYIVGNGKDSIEGLIKEKNKLRSQNPWYRDKILEMNDDLNDIPAVGEKIQAGETSYWNLDGDTTNIDGIVHKDFKDQAVRAVAAIPGLKLAYVHMEVENPTLTKDSQSWKIAMIDADPELSAFHYPWKGKPYNLAKDVVLNLSVADEILWKEK